MTLATLFARATGSDDTPPTSAAPTLAASPGPTSAADLEARWAPRRARLAELEQQAATIAAQLAEKTARRARGLADGESSDGPILSQEIAELQADQQPVADAIALVRAEADALQVAHAEATRREGLTALQRELEAARAHAVALRTAFAERLIAIALDEIPALSMAAEQAQAQGRQLARQYQEIEQGRPSADGVGTTHWGVDLWDERATLNQQDVTRALHQLAESLISGPAPAAIGYRLRREEAWDRGRARANA